MHARPPRAPRDGDRADHARPRRRRRPRRPRRSSCTRAGRSRRRRSRSSSPTRSIRTRSACSGAVPRPGRRKPAGSGRSPGRVPSLAGRPTACAFADGARGPTSARARRSAGCARSSSGHLVACFHPGRGGQETASVSEPMLEVDDLVKHFPRARVGAARRRARGRRRLVAIGRARCSGSSASRAAGSRPSRIA